jgi:hypothetical protein
MENSQNGGTYIHLATNSLNVQCVEWLLENMTAGGIRERDKMGSTAWMRVCSCGNSIPTSVRVATSFEVKNFHAMALLLEDKCEDISLFSLPLGNMSLNHHK